MLLMIFLQENFECPAKNFFNEKGVMCWFLSTSLLSIEYTPPSPSSPPSHPACC